MQVLNFISILFICINVICSFDQVQKGDFNRNGLGLRGVY